MDDGISLAGLKDAVANRRLERLYAEINRLAHASPPEPDRESRILALKQAVGQLRDYQFGFASWTWALSVCDAR